MSSKPKAVLTSGALAGKSIAQITAGGGHTCAVSVDGGAYCWGLNTNGELGTGNLSNSTKPVAVLSNGALAGKFVVQIKVGLDHTCAVTTDGDAYCWGYIDARID
jgi:alpha-tubulin suppressor-like RCC1 family protein